MSNEQILPNHACTIEDVRIVRPEKKFGLGVRIIGREFAGNRIGVMLPSGEWVMYEQDNTIPSTPPPFFFEADDELLVEIVRQLLRAFRPEQVDRALDSSYAVPATERDLYREMVHDARDKRDENFRLLERVLNLNSGKIIP